MAQLSDFSATAFLLADQARATMLTALLGGKALPAGELAYTSGITAQTASAHLAKLHDGGLITVEREGRHRYYRLAGDHIAQALEHLANIQPNAPVRRKALSPKARDLRFCRCCYDHLAGQVSIAVAEGLQERGYILPAADKLFEITKSGAAWFASIGLNVGTLKPTRRGIARQCLDWTERRHHIAGPLGVRMLSVFCESGWMRRSEDSRSVQVTPAGWVELRRHLGVEEGTIRNAGLS